MWEYKRESEKISNYFREKRDEAKKRYEEYFHNDDITDSINSSGNFF